MTLAITSAILVIVGTAGYRTHLLPLLPSFLLLALGLLGSVASVILYLVRIALMVVRHQPGRMGVLATGLVLALVVLAIPAAVVISARRGASGLPAIHDITTDTNDPPAFVDVLPLRADAPNTTEYGGSEIAAQQRQAYPDMTPVVLPMPPDQAFEDALAAVNGMGWKVAGSNRGEGRIEATDTTFWFGFKDDVVIRLRPAVGGTQVDVRSVSRVGGGDVGANAKRIRSYLQRLQTR
jgi:uncharacterized protein (DUF1499 family)